ncbi:MAG: glycoside hydrolase family 3 protein [Faecousia sp.]
MELFDYEKKHLELLRKHLAECTVLLKTNGAFPLNEAGKIAAYGSGVRYTVKGGTGSGEVNSRYFVNVEQGLKDAGFTITTGKWLDAYDSVRVEAKKQFIRDIKARAKAKHTMAIMEGMGAVMPEPEYALPLDGEGDVAVYILSRISGEGNDRNVVGGDVKLSDTEKRDILALNRKYSKFMLVLNVGGPVDLSEVQEVGNILYLSQLGVETGSALADILLGKANPSGKLATTWSAWEDSCPVGEFGDIADTRYNEGIYVGYRYFDSVGKKALYPFGFGLSYTTFSIHTDSVSARGDTLTVTASVTNTGKLPGKEVVQAYVSAPEGRLDKAYQDLAGFAKTSALAPGASETVSVSFKLSDLSSYDTQRSAYILEAGNYILRVGSSSVDTQVAALVVLDDEVIVTQARSCCGKPDFTDWKPENKPATTIDADVPVLCVHASDIPTNHVVYDAPQEIDDAVKDLTDAQLAYLNVGNFSKGGVMSVIGNASSTVAGAAGESCGILKDQGFPVMVMADGPAGLRLSPQFYRDEKGSHTVGGAAIPESMADLLPAPARWFMSLIGGGKPKAGCQVENQYCTAIPIGTALANSWNLELARSCGDIVGEEMERFHVHLWLAPALNIHRSILCGRNFEYFSEDPLISGKMAAAITQGVQKHPGCGTTIKHYAANNQETNRYTNNSMVSERAMREIYLKGFEICVKESQPHALMTSYNLLNGEHTSERRDLIEDILRSEWGYKGIVMTDWIVSMMPMDKNSPYRTPKASLIAAAGSELVMPGDQGNQKDILDGLAKGTVTREQLQINATRLYRMAKLLNK